MRWLVVAVVLVVAAAIALWPRGEGPAPRTPPPGPDVAAARAAAALDRCATGAPGPQHLRGVVATCLGTGEPVDAAAALGGRDLLLNVWATWCLPCREELPLLADYAAGPDAVEVVTLVVQSPQGDALTFLDGIGVTLPTLHDGDESVSRALRLPTGLPASYLVKADGTTTLIADPRVFRSVEDIRAAVAKGLG
ncbi:TlpA family protein disulfide reductase [Actinokineospora sp. NPDC004072]